MANYVLHAGAVSGLSTPTMQRNERGEYVVPFPDNVSAAITTWEQFTFDEGRDLWSFAVGLMDSVEVFVDEVLTAFEDARP